MTDDIETLREFIKTSTRWGGINTSALAALERVGKELRDEGTAIHLDAVTKRWSEALADRDSLRAKLERAKEALEPICNFAWTAVTADCEEARLNLNAMIAELRATLAQLSAEADVPAQQTHISDEGVSDG